MSQAVVVGILLAAGAVAFGATVLIRRAAPGLGGIDPGPWSSTLSYVAAAYGVMIGFSIVFLFGQFASARQAIGDEATSIGTAFEEVRLFPESEQQVQHALICYARSVSEREWPALADGGSAAETDAAFRDIILALGEGTDAVTETFQPAAATNIFLQVGSISTARETRLVAANVHVHGLFWALLLGGGLFVLALIFVASSRAHPIAQAALVGLATVFTVVMILIVFVLSTPFREGAGSLRPELIDQTTALMVSEAPETAARPCAFDDPG